MHNGRLRPPYLPTRDRRPFCTRSAPLIIIPACVALCVATCLFSAAAVQGQANSLKSCAGSSVGGRESSSRGPRRVGRPRKTASAAPGDILTTLVRELLFLFSCRLQLEQLHEHMCGDIWPSSARGRAEVTYGPGGHSDTGMSSCNCSARSLLLSVWVTGVSHREMFNIACLAVCGEGVSVVHGAAASAVRSVSMGHYIIPFSRSSAHGVPPRSRSENSDLFTYEG